MTAPTWSCGATAASSTRPRSARSLRPGRRRATETQVTADQSPGHVRGVLRSVDRVVLRPHRPRLRGTLTRAVPTRREGPRAPALGDVAAGRHRTCRRAGPPQARPRQGLVNLGPAHAEVGPLRVVRYGCRGRAAAGKPGPRGADTGRSRQRTRYRGKGQGAHPRGTRDAAWGRAVRVAAVLRLPHPHGPEDLRGGRADLAAPRPRYDPARPGARAVLQRAAPAVEVGQVATRRPTVRGHGRAAAGMETRLLRG